MSNRNKIITLIVGAIIVIFIIKLFVKLLPLIILLAIAYWVYKKIRPNNDSVNNRKERKDFDFVDADYKETDKK